MNQLQKLILLEKCQDVAQKQDLNRLFNILDSNNVEYHTLALPIIDLGIENNLPVDAVTAFAKGFVKFDDRSIIFDICIPSLGWVFNIERVLGTGFTNYTGRMVEHDVKLFETGNKDADTLNALNFTKETGIDCNDAISTVQKAVAQKLDEMGLEHPFDNNIALRLKSLENNSEMTFNNENFAQLETLLKKKR